MASACRTTRQRQRVHHLARCAAALAHSKLSHASTMARCAHRATRYAHARMLHAIICRLLMHRLRSSGCGRTGFLRTGLLTWPTSSPKMSPYAVTLDCRPSLARASREGWRSTRPRTTSCSSSSNYNKTETDATVSTNDHRRLPIVHARACTNNCYKS